jgi:hypothetical protein
MCDCAECGATETGVGERSAGRKAGLAPPAEPKLATGVYIFLFAHTQRLHIPATPVSVLRPLAIVSPNSAQGKADAMSFVLDYLRVKIAASMENSDTREKRWEDRLRAVHKASKAA